MIDLTYVFLFLVFYTVLLIVDAVPLIKAGDKATLLFYIPVCLITLAINILFSLGMNIPSPAVYIKEAVSRIFGVK